MNSEEIDKHVEIIRNSVYHAFPYNQLVPNFKGPHAENCEGCIIEAEVDILAAKLRSLWYVEEIKLNLKREQELRTLLSNERHHAFNRAGIEDKGQSIADLVGSLVDERDQLLLTATMLKKKLVELVEAVENLDARRRNL